MGRRSNAIRTALFNYGQVTIGMFLGLLVTRALLHILGKDTWGLWAASGSLLAYAGLADLGVLAVLPWVIADADGSKDHDRIRAALSHGLALSSAAALGYVGIALSLWHFYPTLLRLSPHDQALLRGPVLVVVVLSALAFPLRLFNALLIGLQDVTFVGLMGVVQALGTLALTFVLALRGFGLYSLAVGVALPVTLGAVACLVRARVSFPSLLRGWPRPNRGRMAALGGQGLGPWLNMIGFQLASAADPVILSNAGLRTAVTAFVLTSRLPTTLTQLAWILPDAAMVGLAQLNAETNVARVREVALAMLRMNIVLAGVVASAILASNAGFVRLWVGADLFLGAPLNALFAVNTVLLTAVHGLLTVSAVLGKRMTVGITYIANGLLHVGIASFLARRVGVSGVAAATSVSGVLTTLVVGLHLLQYGTGLTVREVLGRVYWPWLRRFAPLAVIAFYIGRASPGMSFALLVAACSAFGMAHMFWMKPLYVDLPFGPRLTAWLSKLRLLPQSNG